jgi:hypothetical protein
MDFRRIETVTIDERAQVVLFPVEKAFILLHDSAVPSLGPGQLDMLGFGRRLSIGFE